MTNARPVDRRPACTACHKAKRKCNKTTPCCLRCKKQNITCQYPAPNSSAFTPLDFLDDGLVDFSAFDSSHDLFAAPSSQIVGQSTCITAPPTEVYSGSWFLEPETWLIDHSKIPIPLNFKMSDLKGFVGQLQDWLEEWVKTGGNAFIHHELYQDKFPACAQIAFTTLSAYIHRTPATTDMIMRSAISRAGELIAVIEEGPTGKLNVLDVLAQVHALLAYQVIGLLDGDFRSRRVSEERCAIFMELLGTLHEKASTSLRQHVIEEEFDDVLVGNSTPARMINREWQAWIVSESVRRTWLLGTGFHAAYEGLTRGETLCGGDLACTTRQGLWEAGGAHAWSKLCIEKDVRFVGRFRAEWLFNHPPDEVDEFSRMMMEITYGRDRTAQWLSP